MQPFMTLVPVRVLIFACCKLDRFFILCVHIDDICRASVSLWQTAF